MHLAHRDNIEQENGIINKNGANSHGMCIIYILSEKRAASCYTVGENILSLFPRYCLASAINAHEMHLENLIGVRELHEIISTPAKYIPD